MTDKPTGLRRIVPGLQWRSRACADWARKVVKRYGRNERRLRRLVGRHQGERAFIIASGPSLLVSDLDRLQKETTFACNKIYLSFDKTAWRPTYYSVSDEMVAKQNQAAIRDMRARKVFPTDVYKQFADCSDITWMESLHQPDVNQCRFSTDLLSGVYGGWTVIFVQMQLAFGMGIRELYVIGLDFSFVVPKTTGELCRGEAVLESKGEVNHFDPRYRAPGEKWTMPRLDLQYNAFKAARDAFAAHGGTIWNASRKTALDVFPRVDLDSILR